MFGSLMVQVGVPDLPDWPAHVRWKQPMSDSHTTASTTELRGKASQADRLKSARSRHTYVASERLLKIQYQLKPLPGCAKAAICIALVQLG